MIVNQQSKKGFGISEILGIATVLIIAAAVVIPGLRDLAKTILESTKTWVQGKMGTIFNLAPGN